MMKGRTLGAVMATLTATLGASLGTLAQAHDHDHNDASPAFHTLSPKEQQRAGELVNIVRGATARYRDVANAQADSYELMFGCVSGSEWGAMGLHYVNMGLVVDGRLDATRPEIVIYEPLPNGRRRIVGADYLVFAADWHAKNTAAPQVEGQLMHLIESPNRYGLPAFYTLHVWAWKDNPNGPFVNWHPKVSCENFEG
jgi:hypothetical protein